ncbi:MAG TPA: hypothetical protein VLI90_14295, partial [Tepidisphaeraceae bacterium]|nr:hypothetical protein [Tepidisphaeraceae bacterium]
MTGHNTGVAGKRGNSIRGNGQKARRSALSLCAAAATVSALGIFAPKARAANVTWLGNNSGSWSDSGNWTTLPASGDSLIFGVAGPNGSSLSDDLITPGTFSDLTFTSAAPGYSIFPSSGNGF